MKLFATSITAVTTVWNVIPTGLKKFVGYGIAAGIAMCMVLFMFLFWGTGLIQEKLGIPTKTDVQAVQDNVRAEREEDMVQAVEFTARYIVKQALDSARMANDSLFNQISNDLIEPGIDKLNSVEANVRRLNERLGLSNDLLKQQAAAQRETNDRFGSLQQQLQGDDDAEFKREVLEQFRSLREEQEEIRNRLKTSKGKF